MAHSGRPRNHASIADSIRQAIQQATTEKALTLIQQADIDIEDGDARTPLIHAALSENTEILVWLLAHDADINHQDRNGWSALHFAVQEKSVEIVRYLLEHGAALESKDRHGNTPLWRATFDAKGHHEIVELLMGHGANPDTKNVAERSPRDFAQQIGDVHLIKILKNG